MDQGSFLTPEMLAAMQQAGSIDPQQRMLEEQLQQAYALKKGIGTRRHTTGLGAALGGAADTINGLTSGVDQALLRHKQQGLLGQQAAANKALMDAFIRSRGLDAGGAPPAAAAPDEGVPPALSPAGQDTYPGAQGLPTDDILSLIYGQDARRRPPQAGALMPMGEEGY